MTRSIGLHSLASSVPEQVLTNEHWREHHPRQVAEATIGERSETREPPSEAFERAQAPFLTDPFRGAHERRVLAPGGTALELEARTAREALDLAGLGPDAVDLLICSCWPGDHHGIGSATYLARELGLSGAAWNVESASASALIALQTACSLIATGQHRNVLIVTSCTHTNAGRASDPASWQLGDAAAAMVVGAVADGLGCLGGHSVHTGAARARLSQQLEAATTGDVERRLQPEQASAEALAEVTALTLEPCVAEALEKSGVTLEEIDHLVVSAPNAAQASYCAQTLGIEATLAPSVFPLYADVGPAMPGVALLHAARWRRFQPGELVLLYAVDRAANASAVVLRWGDVALGALPPGATAERVQHLRNEALDLYRLGRLEQDVIEPSRRLGDAERSLRRLVAGYTTLAIEEPGIMTLFASDSDPGQNDEASPEAVRRSRHFIEILQKRIKILLRQQGQGSRIDPTVAALSLLGIVHWGVCSYRTERRLSRNEAIEQVTRLALHGLTSQPPPGPIWPVAQPLTA
ncbi:MAG: 3-oxoacyl-[acyl-carrier-protein] synthase III C-terminal domain-containing protein [Acidobacteriota bacterium]